MRLQSAARPVYSLCPVFSLEEQASDMCKSSWLDLGHVSREKRRLIYSCCWKVVRVLGRRADGTALVRMRMDVILNAGEVSSAGKDFWLWFL